MYTLFAISLLYCIIYWVYLYKIKETFIFKYEPTLGRMFLFVFTVLNIFFIIHLTLKYLP